MAASQWNSSKPALGDQISDDIPDIEENFEEIQRILEAITNGTLGTTDTSNYRVDGLAPTFQLGHIHRSKFIWIDVNTIYINAGAYDCDGKDCHWVSQLTSTSVGTPTASTWVYLYLDYSAITSGTAITNAELIWSETAPSWSDAKHGWYNGSDRAIFAVYSDASQEIAEFFHDGDLVLFADYINSRSTADLDDTFTDVTLTIPACTTRAQATFNTTYVSETTALYWRTNGQTGSTGHVVHKVVAANQEIYTCVPVITDSSGKIEVKNSAAGGNTVGVNTEGWYFPVGM